MSLWRLFGYEKWNVYAYRPTHHPYYDFVWIPAKGLCEQQDFIRKFPRAELVSVIWRKKQKTRQVGGSDY